MQILLALALVFSQASSEMLYFARQVPEGVSIEVDGDLSDWGWMAPTFCSKDEFAYCSSTEDDFDVVAWVAWSPETNMLYHALKVKDDELSTLPLEECQDMWRWDVFEIYIDADCSGGDYREPHNSRQAQQYYLYCLPGGGGHLGLFGPEGELGWSLRPPYAEYGVRYEGGEIYYEVGMRLWDWLEVSPEGSREHILKAGDVIGWKITVKDRDGELGMRRGCTLIFRDSWRDAGSFSRLRLLGDGVGGLEVKGGEREIEVVLGSEGEISRLELEAWRMRGQGRYDEALEEYKEALEFWDGMKGRLEEEVWASGRVLYLRKIAACYKAMGDLRSAVNFVLSSLGEYERIANEVERETSEWARLKLAKMCYRRRDFELVRGILEPFMGKFSSENRKLQALYILRKMDIERGESIYSNF
ncbi:MAG: hypothetical protein DRQ14_02725 [Candidatus Latescibacterota bacterium]|nr:MAG: hypothetical protein DRQ14_02725 [Candidatus Latescibacterota bacterium]